MYWTIVVGWDDSEQARDALALARALRAADGVVIAACIHPRPEPDGGRVRDRAVAESAEEALRGARAEVTEPWLDTRAVAGVSAAHGLHRLVEEEGADLVVVGSSRGGQSGQVSAGAVGQRLLNGSPCPVAVAPAGFRDLAHQSPSVLGAAYDGSEESVSALREAARLAGELGAAIKLITVVPPLEVWTGDSIFTPFQGDEEIDRSRRDEYGRLLEEAAARLPDEVRVERVLREGKPADQIVEAIREGIDLMAMGSRNYGPLRRVVVGSTAIELIQRAPCPIIVVPRGAANAGGSPGRGA